MSIWGNDMMKVAVEKKEATWRYWELGMRLQKLDV